MYLGPKLLEFETWRLRPLGHHGRFCTTVYGEQKSWFRSKVGPKSAQFLK